MPIRMPRSLTPVLFALFLFSSAAALPAARTSLPGITNVDPCALLTKAEIQDALGKPVQANKRNAASNRNCAYVVGDYGSFSLLVKPLGAGETPDQYAAMLTKSMKSADAPGLGDRAFYTFPGFGMIQLHSFYKNSYILISMLVPGLSEDDQKAPAQKLMKLALSRL